MKTQAENTTGNNLQDFEVCLELADIVNAYFPDYIKTHKIPYHYYNVINAIIKYRTPV